MAATRRELAELAVIRGIEGSVVLCESGLGEPFSKVFHESLYGAAELLEAVRERGETASVVIRGESSMLAQQLLDEPAWQSGHLFIVGSGNPATRAELEAVPWLSWNRVRYVDLEFIPPRVIEDGPGLQRLTGGLGMVELSDSPSEGPRYACEVPVARLLPRLQSALLPPRIAAQELAAAEQAIEALQASMSWRLTSPFRTVKGLLISVLTRKSG